jgi:hypothetical protein
MLHGFCAVLRAGPYHSLQPVGHLFPLYCFEELFYFWEAAMDNVLLLIFGIFLSVLGILNIKGNISTIHSYNRRKVKEEDIPKYGKAVGTGTVIMGASLILAYFATFWNEAAIDYIIFPAITIGLAFILYGQIKYNHGIF